MDRCILHCDMNNFYASVECMLNPSLRDKPVAVCGSAEDRHGIVLAKNYAAKAYGVSTGEAIWQAQQKCHNLVVVEPHYDEYVKFSKAARKIYARYTDLIEPFGMDECWLDVTGSGIYGSGLEIADEIRETIKFELGVTISAGVSFNKIFAKLGSDMKKPDAVTVIDRENFKKKIWGLPASELLGVGRATNTKLENLGIFTIGDLAQSDENVMSLRFGKVGLLLKTYANGEDKSVVSPDGYAPPIKSIGHGITTVRDMQNPADIRPVMLELSQDIGTRLRKHGMMATGVQIDIRDCDLYFKQWQTKLITPTNSSKYVYNAAYELFSKNYDWRNDIRSVTVRAINLVSDDEYRQSNLFEDITKLEREECLEKTIDGIRSRFGKRIIMPASSIGDIGMAPEHVELTMPTGMCR